MENTHGQVMENSMTIFVRNEEVSDPIDDSSPAEHICDLCGFKFSQKKYLTNHYNFCKNIENPAERLGPGTTTIQREYLEENVQTMGVLEKDAIITPIIILNLEDLDITESTDSSIALLEMQTSAELFKCSKCEFAAEDSTQLNKHMKVHNEISKGGSCDYTTTKHGHHKSDYAGRQRSNPIQQMRHHDDKQHKCTICDYWCISEKYLIVHMRNHTKQKILTCCECSYTCAHKWALTVHMRTHTGQKPFQCDKCDYASTQRNNLTQHMSRHSNENPFKCRKCDYAGRKRYILTSHIKTHHPAENPHTCNKCDFSAKLRTDLTQHINDIHTKDKLTSRCNLCDYVTIYPSYIAVHMRKHTGEKPYKCKICDYASTQNVALKRHMLTHTGEKRFRCTVCNFSAAYNRTLKLHMKTRHTDRQQFKCIICDHTCAERSTLTAHIMQTHIVGKPLVHVKRYNWSKKFPAN